MCTGEVGIRGNFKPNTMQKVEILRSEPWRVRAERVLSRRAIGQADFEDQSRSRFGKTLPPIPSAFCLLVRRELVGEAANDAAGFQAL